jgi:hypothetical protein
MGQLNENRIRSFIDGTLPVEPIAILIENLSSNETFEKQEKRLFA